MASFPEREMLLRFSVFGVTLIYNLCIFGETSYFLRKASYMWHLIQNTDFVNLTSIFSKGDEVGIIAHSRIYKMDFSMFGAFCLHANGILGHKYYSFLSFKPSKVNIFSKASVTAYPCRFSDVTAQFTPGHCCLILKVTLNSHSTSCLSNKGSTFCFLPHILTLDCNCHCTTKGNDVTMHTQNITSLHC